MPRVLAALLVGSLLIAPCAVSAGQVRVLGIDGSTEFDPFAAPAGVKAIVFLFTSTDCPISNRYAPEIRRIASTFGPQGVVFRLIYPNPADARSGHPRAHGRVRVQPAPRRRFAIRNHALVKFVGATVTPEVAVVAGGHVLYRGRIDDRFVDLGLERPAPTRHDLADALSAILAGKPVVPATTQAVGCFIADFSR